MAGEKISELLVEATVIADDDRFLMSKDLGGGSWESQYVQGSTLNSLYFQNMGNTNLVSNTADRYFEVTGSTTSDKWGVRAPLSTTNAFEVTGDGQCTFGITGKSVRYGAGGGRIQNNDFGQATLAQMDLFNCRLSNTLNANNQFIRSCLGFFYGGTFDTIGTNFAAFAVGTAPTSTSANAYKQYAADIVAGNAAPHFRLEAGDIVKLYKYVDSSLANSANTGDTNTDNLIDALRDLVISLGVGSAT